MRVGGGGGHKVRPTRYVLLNVPSGCFFFVFVAALFVLLLVLLVHFNIIAITNSVTFKF